MLCLPLRPARSLWPSSLPASTTTDYRSLRVVSLVLLDPAALASQTGPAGFGHLVRISIGCAVLSLAERRAVGSNSCP
uniref:Uncharacterized protein n=1 Tax=Caenorhabditis japonica TaxID=281687 RepID=A0A8R1I4L4_CAEJA